MSLFLQILFFSFLSGVASLAGGAALLYRANWVNEFSLHFVSFAAGAMLATVFFDLLPEGLELAGAGQAGKILAWVLAGFFIFFLLERLILHFHTHHHIDDPEHHHAAPILMQIGDTMHNFVDGVVLAGTFLASPQLGIVTALAIGSHELPQEIGDFSVMLHHGYSRKTVLLANLGSSLASIVGAILAYLLRGFLEPFLPQILALAAGNFIYIAASDLIPELTEKTEKDKTSHIVAMLSLGIFTIWILQHYLTA